MEPSNGKDQTSPLHQIPRHKFSGRSFRAFPSADARRRSPRRGSRRLHRGTRTKRTSSAGITTTVDQPELMDTLRDGWSSRTLSQNKRGREGEVSHQEASTAKPYPDDVCTQKETHKLNKEQPSKGELLLMCTLPKDEEQVFILTLPECITFPFPAFTTALLFIIVLVCVCTK